MTWLQFYTIIKFGGATWSTATFVDRPCLHFDFDSLVFFVFGALPTANRETKAITIRRMEPAAHIVSASPWAAASILLLHNAAHFGCNNSTYHVSFARALFRELSPLQVGCPSKTQILRFLRENSFFIFYVSNTKFAFLRLVSKQQILRFGAQILHLLSVWFRGLAASGWCIRTRAAPSCPLISKTANLSSKTQNLNFGFWGRYRPKRKIHILGFLTKRKICRQKRKI